MRKGGEGEEEWKRTFTEKEMNPNEMGPNETAVNRYWHIQQNGPWMVFQLQVGGSSERECRDSYTFL